jgi:hypothetical protein
MVNTYVSIDGSCKVLVDTAIGGTIKIIQLVNNEILERVFDAESKSEIVAHITPGFYYGNLMMKVAKILDKLVTGG